MKEQYVKDLEKRCEALEEKCQKLEERIHYIMEDGRFEEIPDHDLFSLDYTFARFILPRLEAFRERAHGSCPGVLIENDSERGTKIGIKKWLAIIDEMIEAFKIVEKDCSTTSQEDIDKIERGLKQFSKWYGALWT